MLYLVIKFSFLIVLRNNIFHKTLADFFALPILCHVLTDTELKAKIDAFVLERRKQLVAQSAGTKMDVSED